LGIVAYVSYHNTLILSDAFIYKSKIDDGLTERFARDTQLNKEGIKLLLKIAEIQRDRIDAIEDMFDYRYYIEPDSPRTEFTFFSKLLDKQEKILYIVSEPNKGIEMKKLVIQYPDFNSDKVQVALLIDDEVFWEEFVDTLEEALDIIRENEIDI
jgi:hypothetical protein